MQVTRIKNIIKETETVKTFIFDLPMEAKLGQFVMVWIPGIDEKPMSLSYIGEYAGVTVLKIGEATKKLHEQKEGDLIGLRGPYGRGFEIAGEKLLIVGGGVGVAPLAPLAERASREGKDVTAIIGAMTKEELLFVDRMKKASREVIITTEDGTAGRKGFTTDALKEVLKRDRYDECFTCGPELMMAKVLDQTRQTNIPTQISLERYIKCSLGVCGHCTIDDSGLRVCKEGPVFTDKEIRKSREFGRYRRDASGRRMYWREK